ncbi:hypothetical protein AgCh_026367 [Apium graveolens]
MAPKNVRVKKIKSKKSRNLEEGNQSTPEDMETNTQTDGGQETQPDLQSDSIPATVTTTESENKRYGDARETSQITERKSDATEVSASDVKERLHWFGRRRSESRKIEPEEKPDGAILWKKARMTKEGIVVDPGLAVVVKRICIQSYGLSIMDKASFHEKVGPNEAVKVACVLTTMKEMNVDDEIEYVGGDPRPPEKKGPRSCELSVDNIKNKVAFGTIFDDPVNSIVHGVPMQPGHNNRMEGFLAKKKEKNQLQRSVVMFKEVEGSPQQSSGHECGYVVMRYMKDIIEDKKMTFITKWASKSRKSYKMEELDVVCIETLAYIQDKI